MKSLSKAVAMASLLSAGVMSAQVANAEVSASAGIANLYLWRGQNLSAGSAVVSGSLDYANESGLYAGIWASSGDDSFGNETDLYVGFSGEAGSIGYDISYATYMYPGEDDINDVAEVILGVSMDAFSATLYKNTDVDANGDYIYLTLGAEMGDYAFTLGNVSGTEGKTFTNGDYTHVDVSYAYNDKLSFTYSQVVAEDTDDAYDMGGIFVVSYSLPIE